MNIKKHSMVLAAILSFLLMSGCDIIGESPPSGLKDVNKLWERDIWPLLASECTGCHNSTTSSGGFDITQFDGWINEDSNSDNPYVVQFLPDSSELVWRLEGSNGLGLMPPDSPLAQDTIQLLRRWIYQGAYP